MWTNVLLMGLVINFEPSRIGLIPILLGRDKPALHIAAFATANLTVSLLLGGLILYFLKNNSFAKNHINSPHSQFLFGTLLLVLAIFIVIHWIVIGKKKAEDNFNLIEKKTTSRLIEKISKALPVSIVNITTIWLPGFVGILMGLPSIESIALIMIIASSNAPAMEQTAALISFIVAGNLVVLTPLFSLWIFPNSTSRLIEKLRSWLRFRSQLKYAGMLGIIGFSLMILACL
jgi:hypothetical protein